MNAGIAIILLALGLLATQRAPAQGTLYLSNLDQPPVGNMLIGSDAWIAQSFTTGVNPRGYMLNSFELLMDAGSANPSGFTVSIYSSPGNGPPGSSLGSLSGIDPARGGLFSYAATADIRLLPSTFYYAVATSTTPVAQGAFNWSAADSFGSAFVSPGDPWTVQDAFCSSADGFSWTFHYRQEFFQLGIYSTAVPEPTTLALAGLGLACFSFWRHKQRK